MESPGAASRTPQAALVQIRVKKEKKINFYQPVH
jgi:hypothetical protein